MNPHIPLHFLLSPSSVQAGFLHVWVFILARISKKYSSESMNTRSANMENRLYSNLSEDVCSIAVKFNVNLFLDMVYFVTFKYTFINYWNGFIFHLDSSLKYRLLLRNRVCYLELL